jgi:hypothetical protein
MMTAPHDTAAGKAADKNADSHTGALWVVGLLVAEGVATYVWRPFERQALAEANKDVDAEIAALEQGPHDPISRITTISDYNENTGELLATCSDTLHISFAEQLATLKDSRLPQVGAHRLELGDVLMGGGAMAVTLAIASLFAKKRVAPEPRLS